MPDFFRKAYEWARRNRRTIHIVLTLLVAAVAAIAAVAQAWISASQSPPLPQLRARSISELRIQIEERRETLESEIAALDALLNDLSRAEAVLAGASGATPDVSADPWWLSALKTVVIYIVLLFSAIVSIFALLLDLFALFFGFDFPLLRYIWNWSWREVTLGWYWQRASWTGIAAGVLLILGSWFFVSALDERQNRNTSAPPALPAGSR